MIIFATLDGDLTPVRIAPDTAFSTYWKADDGGQFEQVEIRHAALALDGYTADDRACFRITAIEVDDEAEGGVLTGVTLGVADGVPVVDEATYGPPAVRRLIPKSVVQARLIAAGKMDEVFALLLTSPGDFAKWFAPDWPNVFADDERMIEVLTGVGADIETITAP
jgi:hypothetical protein